MAELCKYCFAVFKMLFSSKTGNANEYIEWDGCYHIFDEKVNVCNNIKWKQFEMNTNEIDLSDKYEMHLNNFKCNLNKIADGELIAEPISVSNSSSNGCNKYNSEIEMKDENENICGRISNCRIQSEKFWICYLQFCINYFSIFNYLFTFCIVKYDRKT